MRKYILSLLGLACCLTSLAQKQSEFEKFGRIKPETLQQKVYSLDSSADAIVLSDIGSASIEGNSKGWFSLVTRRHKVVHILNKNGYREANVEVTLYTDGENEERMTEIKGAT